MNGHFLRINKGFFKDTMRLYLVSAIVFSAIAMLYSYFIGNGMCGTAANFYGFNIPTSHVQTLVGIFMAYMGASLARKLVDANFAEVYASIPVSRDSMWTAYLIMGIIYSAMIIAASTIGMFIGQLAGVLQMGQRIGDFGYSALEYLRDICDIMLQGLISFAFVGTSFAITGKIFAGLVTAGIGLGTIGLMYACLTSTGSVYTALNVIFPFSMAARTAFICVVYVVVTVLLLLLFRKMFLSVRTESNSYAFRNERVQTIVGLMLVTASVLVYAVLIIQMSVYANYEIYTKDLLNESTPILLVIWVIEYIAFMWISGKKFKKAIASLRFLPISLLVVCFITLLGIGLKKAYRNSDFSADNIAYYTLPYNIIEAEQNELYDYDIFFSSYTYIDDDQNSYAKGVTGEDDVRFTDKVIINAIAKLLKGNEMIDNTGIWEMESKPTIWVTLKDGRTYAFSILNDEVPYIKAAMKNEEYRKAMYDIEPFKGGHFVHENSRANALYDTFIEELSALSIDEREKLFDIASVYGFESYVENGFQDTEISLGNREMSMPYARVLYIANSTNSCIRGIILNESTPKTLEAYLKLSNELNAKNTIADDALKLLENKEMNVELRYEFMVWDREKQESHEYTVSAEDGMLSMPVDMEISDDELKMLNDFLMDSFHVSLDELNWQDIQMAYLTFDFTLGTSYYEQWGIDEEYLTDEKRKEDLMEMLGTDIEDPYGEEYISDAIVPLTRFLHGNTELDSCRYVVTISKMNVTGFKLSDGFGYDSYKYIDMDSLAEYYSYPMSYGISEEDYNGFIHDFIEKYSEYLH